MGKITVEIFQVVGRVMNDEYTLVKKSLGVKTLKKKLFRKKWEIVEEPVKEVTGDNFDILSAGDVYFVSEQGKTKGKR